MRVGDTGTGMPTDVMDHVFEPFFTTKADGSGTGLGLATVYGIVTQSGGTIRLDSRPGIGTTFTIVLPVTDQVAAPVEESWSLRRTPQGETILVVEDEEALREVTERIFNRSGYRVLTAANGPDAVELATAHEGPIDLLVTDVVMPHMLGREVADRIRALRPDVRVLYMSGYAQPVLASQGRLDPDAHLIEKPFSADTLVETAGLILNALPPTGELPVAAMHINEADTDG
jgi:CheY-like chemotaxis protein